MVQTRDGEVYVNKHLVGVGDNETFEIFAYIHANPNVVGQYYQDFVSR